MIAFEYFLQVMRKILNTIFRHEALAGTGISFLDIGVFFLILNMVVIAIVVSVRASDEMAADRIHKDRMEARTRQLQSNNRGK